MILRIYIVLRLGFKIIIPRLLVHIRDPTYDNKLFLVQENLHVWVMLMFSVHIRR
jgi:hypothetical protein